MAKRKRKCIILAVLLLAVCLFLGMCAIGAALPDYYKLAQSDTDITQIQLFYVPEYDAPFESYMLLTELPKDKWSVFLASIYGTPCNKVSHDPPNGVGQLAIRIVYTDNAIEIIGDSNGLYLNGKRHVIKGYTYDKEAFRALFLPYVDEALLPTVIDGYWESEYPFI